MVFPLIISLPNGAPWNSVIGPPPKIFIFEFKYDGSLKNAMAQIHKKRYYESFLSTGKEIMLVAGVFK